MLQVTLIAVAVVNVLTFLIFGFDKWRARRGKRRISEATLLGFSFCAGLVGGWVGMSVFRHKTKKTSFQVKMVLVSLFNLAWVLVWLWYRGDLV